MEKSNGSFQGNITEDTCLLALSLFPSAVWNFGGIAGALVIILRPDKKGLHGNGRAMNWKVSPDQPLTAQVSISFG